MSSILGSLRPTLVAFVLLSCVSTDPGEIAPRKIIENGCTNTAFEKPLRLSKNWYMKLGFVECQDGTPYSIVSRASSEKGPWKQSGPYIEGARSQHIAPTKDGVAYLVISHFVEGPGPEYLYKTQDLGKTWKFISKLNKGSDDSHSSDEHLLTITSFCAENKRLYYSVYNLQTSKHTYYKSEFANLFWSSIPPKEYPCKKP